MRTIQNMFAAARADIVGMDLRIGQIQIPRRRARRASTCGTLPTTPMISTGRGGRRCRRPAAARRSARVRPAIAAPATRSRPRPRACRQYPLGERASALRAECAPFRSSPPTPCGIARAARARARWPAFDGERHPRQQAAQRHQRDGAELRHARHRRHRSCSARWKVTIASRLLNRFAGSVRRADSTFAASKPGETACTFAKLLASIVITTSNTTASATSAPTSAPRMRGRRCGAAAAALERVAHVHPRRGDRRNHAEDHARQRRRRPARTAAP